MLPAASAGAAADFPDAIEEMPWFEFAETADVVATAPAPTLRKSRRVVFISTPPGEPACVKCEPVASPSPGSGIATSSIGSTDGDPNSAKTQRFHSVGTHG